jgi:hypothetical protein
MTNWCIRMSQNHDANYEIADIELSKTPARLLHFDYWPRRRFLRSAIAHHEWLDWGEVFSEGAAEKLFRVSRELSSSTIGIACFATDNDRGQQRLLRTISIEPQNLDNSYYKAMWDDRTTFEGVSLGFAARVALIWDSSEKWIIVNDRFYEIALFAILDRSASVSGANFFQGLTRPHLLSRFSEIMRVSLSESLIEIEQWSGESSSS